MSIPSTFLLRALPLCLALVCASLPAHAAKPEWVEDGKHSQQGKPDKSNKSDKSHEQDKARSQSPQRSDDRRTVSRPASPSGVSVQVNIGGYFNDDQRQYARGYYEPRFKAGKCPPGLAKKHNGCLPPGQAKKWHRGEPLPRGVVYYPVPSAVQIRLGAPPVGHKYVRVAADILLIAIGTGMVIDAIEDLGNL